MEVYLIDGTYELFRHFYAMPSARDEAGREVGAIRGVLASVLGLVQNGVTHIAVATDHVIESFRNGLWPGYKTSAGVEASLLAQFTPLEQTLTALGVVVWPMVEFEADDALAAGAAKAALDPRVERVVICTPDKDLGQSFAVPASCSWTGGDANFATRRESSRNLVCRRRRFRITSRSWGMRPTAILVCAGWGPKSTAAVLARFGHLESIPEDSRNWHVNAAHAGSLAATLIRERERAFLFRDLATLRTNIPLFDSVDELKWTGPRPEFAAIGKRLDQAVTTG